MNPLRIAQYAAAGVGIVGGALAIFINGTQLNNMIKTDFSKTETTDVDSNDPKIVEAN